jgi:DNA-binding XRE family transcriptional regulator
MSDEGRNGRPPYVPSQRDRDTVTLLVATGVTQDDMCKLLGISRPTLRRAFAAEIETGALKANLRIANALFSTAMKGNAAAQIFWLRCRARWTMAQPSRDDDADEFEPMGKKDRAQAAAATAGEDSQWSGDWGNDLTYTPSSRVN